MNKLVLFLAFFLTLSHSLSGQEIEYVVEKNTKDSLFDIIKNRYVDIQNLYYQADYDQVKVHLMEIIELTEARIESQEKEVFNKNSTKVIVPEFVINYLLKSYSNLSVAEDHMGNYHTALKHLEQFEDQIQKYKLDNLNKGEYLEIERAIIQKNALHGNILQSIVEEKMIVSGNDISNYSKIYSQDLIESIRYLEKAKIESDSLVQSGAIIDRDRKFQAIKFQTHYALDAAYSYILLTTISKDKSWLDKSRILLDEAKRSFQESLEFITEKEEQEAIKVQILIDLNNLRWEYLNLKDVYNKNQESQSSEDIQQLISKLEELRGVAVKSQLEREHFYILLEQLKIAKFIEDEEAIADIQNELETKLQKEKNEKFNSIFQMLGSEKASPKPNYWRIPILGSVFLVSFVFFRFLFKKRRGEQNDLNNKIEENHRLLNEKNEQIIKIKEALHSTNLTRNNLENEVNKLKIENTSIIEKKELLDYKTEELRNNNIELETKTNELKRKNQELESKALELEQTNREIEEKKEMFKVLSRGQNHQFKNSLLQIANILKLQKQPFENENQEAYKIFNDTEWRIYAINKLLELVRIKDGSTTSTANLGELLNNLKDNLQMLFNKKEHKEEKPLLDIVIQDNAGLLNMVEINIVKSTSLCIGIAELVFNAFKHSPELNKEVRVLIELTEVPAILNLIVQNNINPIQTKSVKREIEGQISGVEIIQSSFKTFEADFKNWEEQNMKIIEVGIPLEKLIVNQNNTL